LSLNFVIGFWVLGFGFWGLGFGVWGLGPTPNSPIPNPQSPIPNPHFIAKFTSKNVLKKILSFIIKIHKNKFLNE
jgi:hypothetical protein